MKSTLAPGLVFPSDRVSRFIIYCHLIFHQIRSCHVFQWLGSQPVFLEPQTRPLKGCGTIHFATG